MYNTLYTFCILFDMVVVLNRCMYLFHSITFKSSRTSKPLALVHGLVAVGGILFLYLQDTRVTPHT